MVLGLAAGLARAEEPARSFVIDKANLFGKGAVAEANREIAEIRKRFDVDLVIETLTEMPPENDEVKRAWIKWPARNRQLHDWAQARAEKMDINGLYAVIFHGPTSAQRDVRVVGWPVHWEFEDRVSDVKRELLRKKLARELSKNPDRALLEMVSLFYLQMVRLKEPDPSPLRTGVALIVIGSLVGAGLLLAGLRSRLARKAAQGGPPEPLFQPATLGALCGVPAAFWVHDQLFRVSPPESPIDELPADLPLEPPPEPAPQTPLGEDNPLSDPYKPS
jgi:hypothetical protein